MLKNKRLLALVLALVLFVTAFPVIEANAATASDYAAGCWAYAYTTTTVYANSSLTGTTVGSIGPSEGVTVLKVQTNSSGETVYYINYSAPGGDKFGYVLWSQVCVDGDDTVVEIISSASTVYYTTQKDVSVGSVSSGEIVSVLSEYKEMYYIEYNVTTTGTRKRGYVPKTCVTLCNTAKTLKTFWRCETVTYTHLSQSYDVYLVPNPNFETFATVSTEDEVFIYSRSNVNGLYFSFICFTDRRVGSATYGQLVTGYILK